MEFEIVFDQYKIQNLGRLNFLLGKNGSGKSRFLKHFEANIRGRTDQFGNIRYISPERAGVLTYEPSVEHNINQNEQWLADVRRVNQSSNFRQQSAAQFRRLELMVLREIEINPARRSDSNYTFELSVNRINSLLDRIYVRRNPQYGFTIHDKATHAQTAPDQISSGESELISLGIECLVFVNECKVDKDNILLFDEPDVHLHPDLQARLGRFLSKLLDENPHISLVLATHSTAFLGAAPLDESTRVSFMRPGTVHIIFSPVGDMLSRVLPVFGAHPLSNIFNESPALLVEGEDDERIWQQAVRTAKGLVKVYPVPVDSVSKMNEYENEVLEILDSVYDDAVAFSLRDRDDGPNEITDLGSIRRLRMNCRSAENLLLTDDVLQHLGLNWEQVQIAIENWIKNNQFHPHFKAVCAFKDGGYDRMGANLKVIRNDLVGLMGSNKAWEIIVGQAIAFMVQSGNSVGSNSLRAYLGEKVCTVMLRMK